MQLDAARFSSAAYSWRAILKWDLVIEVEDYKKKLKVAAIQSLVSLEISICLNSGPLAVIHAARRLKTRIFLVQVR